MSNDRLKYTRMEHKGYTGTIEYDRSDCTYYGGVIDSDDCILYEGKSIDEIEKNFMGAVDGYLKDCKQLGRNPR